MEIPRMSEKASVPAIAHLGISSCPSPSLEAARLADRCNALMPRVRDSAKTRMPRKRGTLRSFPVAQEPRRSWCRWMEPSGRRTAKAKCVRPRIITPSMTAWPP